MVVRPTVNLEVAFATDPNSTAPTYKDISDHWLSCQIHRGRQQELDEQDRGTATVTLQDFDRRFEKNYAGKLINLIFNPSVENALTDYSAVASTTTRDASAGIVSGSYGVKVVTTNVIDSGFLYSYAGDVVAGQTYWFTLSGFRATGTGSVNWHFIWYWWNDVGGTVPNATPTTTTASVSFNSNNVRRLQKAATVPAGAVRVDIQVSTVAASGTDSWYFDGLQLELDQNGGGTNYCDGDQDNCRWGGTAHYSVSYRGGPYYPNVVPRRKIRVSGTWNSTQSRMFTGYVKSWPNQWPMAGNRGELQVTAEDGFAVLAKKKINTTFPQQRTEERIFAALDDVHWPTTERNVDIGLTIVQSATVADESCLSHIQRANRSEDGRLFVAVDGKVTFLNRHSRFTSGYATPRFTFGDAGAGTTELPYVDIEIANDDILLYNEVTLQRDGGVLQTSSNAQSVSAYWKNTLSITNLLTLDDNEVAAQTSAYLERYKDPALRITKLVIDPYQDPNNLFPAVLGIELGDRITVKRRPANSDNPSTDTASGIISQDSFVEGIDHAFDRDGHWRTEFALSAIGVGYSPGPFFTLDSTAYGILDSTVARIWY